MRTLFVSDTEIPYAIRPLGTLQVLQPEPALIFVIVLLRISNPDCPPSTQMPIGTLREAGRGLISAVDVPNGIACNDRCRSLDGYADTRIPNRRIGDFAITITQDADTMPACPRAGTLECHAISDQGTIFDNDLNLGSIRPQVRKACCQSS